MGAESLQELFVEELRDIYDGEKRLLKALPQMARAAESEELQAAFTSHLRETERQVGRLEQVFRTVGEPVRGKRCDGIMGILEEGKKAMEELEGAVLDAALIAGAQKVEHYEIATYGTLAYFAELLGDERSKNLLGETLDEEKAADEKLNTIAKSDVNRDALTNAGSEEGDDQEQADEGGGVLSGLRRTVSAGRAADRPRRRSTSRTKAQSRSRGTSSRRSSGGAKRR